eukprot:TRINITY_DN3165_c0_g1_i4.p1 TRINITY_DN3165_c0_g1~~TRINITY_DN3165_c0_g1_i4.p1  ORF type:complete len:1004 (-),score=280.28 TRINITY_DN3165_c0_g1_i4:45-3056(-)
MDPDAQGSQMTDEDVLASIPPEMYKDEGFDVLTFIFGKLPADISADEINNELQTHERMLDVVSGKLSGLIMNSYGAFVEGMSQVHDIDVDLQQSTVMCKEGRRHLANLQTNLTHQGITILAKYQRRQAYTSILDELQLIKRVQNTEQAMRRLLAEGDYPQAITLCVECQGLIQQAKHLQCVHTIGTGIAEAMRMIGDRMDRSLQDVCNTFNEHVWARVLMGHRQLGRENRLLERLLPCFVDNIEPHTKKIVKSHVILSEAIARAPEQLKTMRFKDMCGSLEDENFLDCLLAVLEYLTDLMVSHYCMARWLYDRLHPSSSSSPSSPTTTSSSAEGEQQEPSPSNSLDEADTNLYNELYGRLTRIKKGMWKNMEQQVAMVVAACKGTCKLEDFMRMLDAVDQFIHIGESFSRSEAFGLRASLKQQSKVFFEQYHKSRMEDLRTMLEHDMWQRCPIPLKFDPLDVKEFAVTMALAATLADSGASASLLLSPASARKSDDTKEKSLDAASSSSSSGDLKEEEGSVRDPALVTMFSGLRAQNPFARIGEKRAMGRNLSSTLSMSSAGLGNVDAQPYTSSSSDHQGEEGRMITSTTINVVRFLGKYMQLMHTLSAIAYDIFSAMTQLFEFYVYGVYVFFGSNPLSSSSGVIGGGMGLGSGSMSGGPGGQGSKPTPQIGPAQGDTSGPSPDDPLNNASGELKKMLTRMKSKFNPTLLIAVPGTPPNVSSLQALSQNGGINTPNVKVPALHSVEVGARANLYGIRARVLGIESILFAAEAMHEAQPLVQTLIPPARIDQAGRFYLETVSLIKELRTVCYRTLAHALAVPIDAFINQIATAKWDIKQIDLDHSPYVDPLIKEVQSISKRLDDFSMPPNPGDPPAIPARVKAVLWETVVQHVMECLVEGYSRVKKCTPEGRAVMSLDVKVVQSALEKLSPIRPIPFVQYADAYIKAFYLPPNEADIASWARDHPAYSLRQVQNLVACAFGGMKKGQRESLLKQLEEIDRNKRR